MDAELRHIHAFLAVARLVSFTRAAASLRVSQPALTVQIKQLEQALGVKLFDRNNRRVALTPAGRSLVAPFERVLFDLEAVTGHARDLADRRLGIVTVAALPSIAAGVLPRAIRALADRHQRIVVRLRDVTAGQVVALVKSGDADFGVGSLVRPDVELTAESLYTDRLCAFMLRDHVLARRRHVTLRAVSAYALILTSHDSSVRQVLERALEHWRLAVQVAQEATHMTTAIGMVRAGLGIAILPESAAEIDRGDDLRRVAIRAPSLTRQISLLVRADRSLSPAAQTFAAVIRQQLS